jgi:type I restriction enzyme S subunit
MLGDPVSAGGPYQAVTLESVAELINGDRSSNYPSGDDLVEDGVLFLSTKNIQNGEINLTTCQFITPEKFRSLTRGKLRRHDIVITLRGTLGQCAEFDCDFETGFINAQMMIIRARDQLRPLYLRSFLSHPRTQALLQRDSSGSAVPQLTGKQIGELLIPIPPIEIQDEFSVRVGKIQKVALQSLLHDARLARLFSSLQHCAFAGEL